MTSLLRADVGRMGAAVNPSGDGRPRQHLEVGVIIEAPISDEQGAFVARVHLLESDMDVTAAIAVPWAGAGYGTFLPPELDDKVLCQPIQGLPDAGWVITARVWERSTPAPVETQQRADALILAKLDQSLRLAVQGIADLIAEARGGGKVKLGLDTADDPVALQSTLDAFNSALDHAIAVMTIATDPAVTALQALQNALDAVNFPICALKVVAV